MYIGLSIASVYLLLPPYFSENKDYQNPQPQQRADVRGGADVMVVATTVVVVAKAPAPRTCYAPTIDDWAGDVVGSHECIVYRRSTQRRQNSAPVLHTALFPRPFAKFARL